MSSPPARPVANTPPPDPPTGRTSTRPGAKRSQVQVLSPRLIETSENKTKTLVLAPAGTGFFCCKGGAVSHWCHTGGRCSCSDSCPQRGALCRFCESGGGANFAEISASPKAAAGTAFTMVASLCQAFCLHGIPLLAKQGGIGMPASPGRRVIAVIPESPERFAAVARAGGSLEACRGRALSSTILE